MRVGCAMIVATIAVVCGMAAGSLWIGSRMLQEPEVPVAAGTAEDGVRGQQKKPGHTWQRLAPEREPLNVQA